MTATMQVGKYRLVHRDNRDNSLGEILELHSQSFGGVVGTPQADPQKMPKVKKNHQHILRQDDKLVIMFMPTTLLTEHSTAAAAANTIQIPVTVNNVRSGFVYETQLTVYDFTDQRAYANNQVWTPGKWYDIWSLTVGAQLELKIGHNIQDVRVDGALNLQKDSTTS
jgi:alpha-glucosidase (family GH31 glycosyl hydrolase)